jgi:TonB family protein
MPKDVRFWRNVALIGIAHIALVTGLIRWSHQTRPPPSQSIVWMDGGGGDSGAVPADTPVATPRAVSTKSPTPIPEPETTPADASDEQEPVLLTAAKSEIQLPTTTPAPSSTPALVPKPSTVVEATPKPPRPKPTPKPTPKETPKPKPKPKATPKPKKLVMAKAPPKPSPKATPIEEDEVAQEDDAPAEKEKPAKPAVVEKPKPPNNEAVPKKTVVAVSGNGKGTSVGAGGHASGSGGESQFGWYGNMLHDRFHGEWDQPTSEMTAGSKVSVLVKIRIEKDGRVSNFEIVKPSGNPAIDQSVAAVAKRVTQVDPLPAGLGNGEHYDVKINFELSSEP